MSMVRNFLLKPWIYVVIVLIGTLLKFYQLNSKLFWVDEISTVLYTSGINGNIIQKSIPVNQIMSYGYYDSLLHLSTKAYSLKKEVTGILSDTHLTPAHYVFLTLWYRLAGDNDMDYRLFSVFIFILSLPFTFLLAKTLFNSNLAGWIALSLYAVSPFIHFQAQEARYYILWVFFFIVSNYLFLQAIKYNRFIWWIGYSIAAVLALYTSLSSSAFIFGHLVYTLLFKKERRIQFIVTLIFIVLAYLPWMYFLYTVRETIESGLAWHKFSHSSFFSLDLLFYQLLGFARSFAFLFDINLYWMWSSGTAPSGIYTALVIDLVLLAFIIYSIFYLFTKTSKEIRWFVILIILPLFMVLYISDIVRNGFTSLLWRYQIVNMAGISLIVTNLLKDKIAKGKWLYLGIYFGLLLFGIASILKIAANRCWNTSPDCEYRIEEAQLISHAVHPLIITDFSGLGIDRSLSVLNDSKATKADIMYCKGTIPNLKEKIAGKAYSEIYLLAVSDTLVQQVKSQFGKTMLPYKKETSMMSPQVWQIKLK
jgi:uncharacterized membrane protein